MWTAERVVAELRRSGELWEVAPGLIGLRGDALALQHGIESGLRRLARAHGADEWLLPPALPLETLARADYFASFPQWLTVAAHLSDDDALLEGVAAAADPVAAVNSAVAAPAAALQPALCYHVYAAHHGRRLDDTVCITCQGTCWRHERERLAPLERGWAFTMREVICLGGNHEVAAFLARQRAAAVALAVRLGLEPEIEPASDPFFAPTARGRALLQRVRGLKDELLLPVGGGGMTAAASFNNHDRFFGDAFDISCADTTPAVSGCAAFGVERWVLALLVAHGPSASAWPDPSAAAAAAAPRATPVHVAC
ncbi:amino acid--[acyl-carrier-protein] ligase [soil metagenome]